MHHKKKIRIPIYGGTLKIHLTDSKKIASKISGQEEIDVFAFQMVTDYDEYTILLNPEHPTADITYGIVAHECMHVLLKHFHRRNIDISVDNEEPSAYMIEWLVDQVVSFMHEKGYRPVK